MPRRVAAIALLMVVAGVAVGPIRSYDFFWHITTGRWIVEHHALPLFDPFTLAAAHVPWINGEWLWEVVAYAIPLGAMSWINAIFVGAMFALAFWFASRDLDWPLALVAAGFAFAGAYDRLGIRPAEAAAFLAMCAIALLGSRLPLLQLTISYAILTILWINTHPSALLAPVFAVSWAGLNRQGGNPLKPLLTPLVSAAALLVNPFGWRALAAPLQLTTLERSGEFVNAEWLPSAPALFPLLYATAVVIVIAFIASPNRRQHLWRLAIFSILVTLAIQHVRNQSLYFASLPLLLPPVRIPRWSALIAIAPIAWVWAHADHFTGVDSERFPVRAVSQLQRSGLQGNIYNVDQFGGYLEWIFYPQRRVLTDGRNELFRDFIAEDARARTDSRVWHAMVQRFQVALAVDEYQRERIEVVDVASGERRYLPSSLVRYRRRDWALIAFDDATMIFARRSAFPAGTIDRIEYRFLVPDDPQIGYLNDQFRGAARAEVERAKREFGEINVVRQLEAGTK